MLAQLLTGHRDAEVPNVSIAEHAEEPGEGVGRVLVQLVHQARDCMCNVHEGCTGWYFLGCLHDN